MLHNVALCSVTPLCIIWCPPLLSPPCSLALCSSPSFLVLALRLLLLFFSSFSSCAIPSSPALLCFSSFSSLLAVGWSSSSSFSTCSPSPLPLLLCGVCPLRMGHRVSPGLQL